MTRVAVISKMAEACFLTKVNSPNLRRCNMQGSTSKTKEMTSTSSQIPCLKTTPIRSSVQLSSSRYHSKNNGNNLQDVNKQCPQLEEHEVVVVDCLDKDQQACLAYLCSNHGSTIVRYKVRSDCQQMPICLLRTLRRMIKTRP